MNEPIICYMDMIAWQHELGHDAMGTKLFASVETLKACHTCIDKGGCGVVKVEVRLMEVVEQQDLDRKEGKGE